MSASGAQLLLSHLGRRHVEIIHWNELIFSVTRVGRAAFAERKIEIATPRARISVIIQERFTLRLAGDTGCQVNERVWRVSL